MVTTAACCRRLALLFLLFGFARLVGAQPTDPQIETVRKSLSELLPDLQPDSILPTPMPNLYEVVVGARLIYVTGDGRFLMEGELTDLARKKNLTTPRLHEVTLAAVNAIGEENMLIFEPSEKTQYTITVFTDIDSAFSRKLHQEIAQYTRRGIRVRYLFFPRAGTESHSYQKAVTVWCAKDRIKALDQAMSGQAVEPADCPNPVQAHLKLAGMIGVSGAPVLVLENGDMIPGYVSADRLGEILKKIKQLTHE